MLSDEKGVYTAYTLRGALDCGLRVPADFSLVGVDNTDIAAHLPIPFTTIASPYQEIVWIVVDRFYQRKLAETNSTEAHETVLPTRLVVRESSGPAGGENGENQSAWQSVANPPVGTCDVDE